MTTHNKDKLKILFQMLRPGNLITSTWLEKQGISRSLQKYYLKSGWLEPFGRGVYRRPGDEITWQDAVYTIQNQSDLEVHIAASTSLSLQGYSHYLRLGQDRIFLFTPYKKNLPKWFTDTNWNADVHPKQTMFIPPHLGLSKIKTDNNTLAVSSPERAILECLYLVPNYFDLIECFQLMEGLVNLKPKLLSELLKECSSIQVKRLFLYMAEKSNHQWLQFIKKEDINLGNGNRMISKHGVYISKYQISIPKELAEI